MQVQIVARNLELTGANRQIVERRLGFALARFRDRVQRVKVLLQDLNGPKGGMDQHCRIEVRLVPSGRIEAEATDAHAVLAVSRAIDRIGRRVRDALDRRRTRRT